MSDSSDSILGIDIPGAPKGDPNAIEAVGCAWDDLAQRLGVLMPQSMNHAAQLNWQSAGAASFQEGFTNLTQKGTQFAENLNQVGLHIQAAANALQTAQTNYNISMGKAAATVGLGIGLSLLTFGISDAAAVAAAPAIAAEMTSAVAEAGATITSIVEAIANVAGTVLRIVFTVVGQFGVNIASQEINSVVQHGHLTGPNMTDALLYSMVGVIPGASGLKGIALATAEGGAMSAISQELSKGQISMGELVFAATLSGGLHAGVDAANPGEGGAGGTGETPASSAAPDEVNLDPSTIPTSPTAAGDTTATAPPTTAPAEPAGTTAPTTTTATPDKTALDVIEQALGTSDGGTSVSNVAPSINTSGAGLLGPP